MVEFASRRPWLLGWGRALHRDSATCRPAWAAGQVEQHHPRRTKSLRRSLKLGCGTPTPRAGPVGALPKSTQHGRGTPNFPGARPNWDSRPRGAQIGRSSGKIVPGSQVRPLGPKLARAPESARGPARSDRPGKKLGGSSGAEAPTNSRVKLWLLGLRDLARRAPRSDESEELLPTAN